MNTTSSRVYVVTGRFNNETWNATLEYREKHQLACIYAPPCKISDRIEHDAPVFVLEMNNTLNQIMGVGLVRNKPCLEKRKRVYRDTNLNRYVYIGKYHLTREQLVRFSPPLVEILDHILFKGYTHSKRGMGLTQIPEKVLNLDICRGLDLPCEIRSAFLYYYRKDPHTCAR